MKYPNRVQEILNALVAVNRDLAKGTDDDRRALTMKIAQQIRFELGAAWGTKSADPGRPPSKDSIAMQDGAKLWGWDTINGSTREPNVFPDAEDITGQNFIAVTPVDYLGATGSIPQPPPVEQPPIVQPPVQCAVDLAPVEARLDMVLQKLDEAVTRSMALALSVSTLRAQLDEIKQRQDRAFTGKVFGVNFTLDVRKE